MRSNAHITIEVDDDGFVEFICKSNGPDEANRIMLEVMDLVDKFNGHNSIAPTETHGVQ